MRLCGNFLGNVQAALLDTSCFARQDTQVEQTSPTYFTTTDNFDLVDVRRQEREDTLGTNLVGNLTNGEGFAVGVRVLTLNYNTLELLNTLLVALANFHVNIDSVAGSKTREAGAALLGFLLNKIE